jgi:hypothetical protein
LSATRRLGQFLLLGTVAALHVARAIEIGHEKAPCATQIARILLDLGEHRLGTPGDPGEPLLELARNAARAPAPRSP